MARTEFIWRNVARNARKVSRLNYMIQEHEGNVNEFEFMPK